MAICIQTLSKCIAAYTDVLVWADKAELPPVVRPQASAVALWAVSPLLVRYIASWALAMPLPSTATAEMPTAVTVFCRLVLYVMFVW